MKNIWKQIKGSSAGKILLLLPIMMAIAVIPLIMRVKDYDPQLSKYDWFPNVLGRLDVFLFYKNYIATLLCAALVLCFAYLYLRRRLVVEWMFLPLALYLVLMLLSSIYTISEYHTWNGFMDMFESAFTLLTYCLICYFSYTVIQSEKQIKAVFIVFAISFVILGVIGVSQFFKHDLFTINAIRNIIFSTSLKSMKETFGTQLNNGIVYLTFFNPNYVGVYSCIMVPLLIVLTFTARQKRFLLFYILSAILILVALVGSGSKTAVLALIPCILFAVCYFGKRNLRRILPVLAIYILIFAGLNKVQPASVFESAMDRFTTQPTASSEFALKALTLEDEQYLVSYRNRKIAVSYKEAFGKVIPIVQDESKKELKLNETTINNVRTYMLKEAAFTGLSFMEDTDKDGDKGLSVKSEGSSFFIFYAKEKHTYLYTNYYGKHTKIYAAETLDLPIFHLMGGFSGRGYIWSKTLPLLKNTLILGTGPDTYAIAFPQEDYVSLVQNGCETLMITKPHCMFLQIGEQTGILSLIAMLSFYSWYFMQSFLLYKRSELLTWTERVGAAIFVSSIGFMIASLVNDSTIGVSMIFWTLLGIGCACNKMVKEICVKSKINLKR
jgi:hypothetical protein